MPASRGGPSSQSSSIRMWVCDRNDNREIVRHVARERGLSVADLVANSVYEVNKDIIDEYMKEKGWRFGE